MLWMVMAPHSKPPSQMPFLAYSSGRLGLVRQYKAYKCGAAWQWRWCSRHFKTKDWFFPNDKNLLCTFQSFSRILRSPLWCRITTVASCCPLNRRIPRRSALRLEMENVMGKSWGYMIIYDIWGWRELVEQAQDGGYHEKIKCGCSWVRYIQAFPARLFFFPAPFSTRKLPKNCWSKSYSSK